MPALPRCFSQHPASVGESYAEHMRTALSFAGPLALAAGAALVHAFLPWLFVTQASRTVKALHERMTRRCKTCPAGRRHHPELFVSEQKLLGWDSAIEAAARHEGRNP